MNGILAILEVKGILTHDEALELAQYFAERPQANRFMDALADVKNLIDTLDDK